MKISSSSRARLYLACTLVEAIAVSSLSRIRRAIGRKRAPDARELFLRLFLLHIAGRPPRLRITCAERSDGAGAQAHTIMSAINFAHAFGHTYVHTPFSRIDHADRDMEEWVEAWEELFNLGEGEERSAPDRPKALNYSTFHPRLYHAVCRLLEGRAGKMGQRKLRPGDPDYHFQPFFFHSDSNPDSYRAVLPQLRRKYYRSGRPERSDVIRVAVHMRRGDVTAAHPQRYSCSDAVCATTRSVVSALQASGEAFSLALYSQGEALDFHPFETLDTRFFLDADPIWTMRQLIAADILIMSKSSFSYVAALISDGVKLYEPFCHSPLSDWIVRDGRGRFDQHKFQDSLARLIKARGTRSSNP